MARVGCQVLGSSTQAGARALPGQGGSCFNQTETWMLGSQPLWGETRRPMWCKMAQLQQLFVLAPFSTPASCVTASYVTLDKALLCPSA